MSRVLVPMATAHATAFSDAERQGAISHHIYNFMKTKSKIFQQSLHDENDLPARKVVKEFYARIGIMLIDNPDKYGVDLITEDDSLCVEVERRMVWNTDEFPFADVNFLQRKVKFFDTKRYSLHEYAIVSTSMKRIGICNEETIMAIVNGTTPKESPNRFVNDSEYFYKIPKSKFFWFNV